MRIFFLLLAMLPLPILAEEQTGAQVYALTCRECHGQGKHGAPMFGDRQRWQKLIREGLNDLVPSALKGMRQMPAKGGNAALSDLEVARAVIHMANAGGATFAEPTPVDIARWRAKADRRKSR